MSAYRDELLARERLHPRSGNVIRLRRERASLAEEAGARGDTAGPGIDCGTGMGGSVSPPDVPAGPADPPEIAA